MSGWKHPTITTMDGPGVKIFTEDADLPRAFRRFPVNFPVRVSLSRDKPTVRGSIPSAKTAATLTNASMNGLYFSSLTEFPQDKVVEIELDFGSQTHRVLAIIRRCSSTKRLGRTFYECGVQYLKSEVTLQFVPTLAKYLLTLSFEQNSSEHEI
ncbi:MAG: PilZ domain-containing protein [Janthinobacterium lividum]